MYEHHDAVLHAVREGLLIMDGAGRVVLATAQQLADQVVSAVEEPALAALLLGKAAQAHEKGVVLVVTADTEVTEKRSRHGIWSPWWATWSTTPSTPR